MFTEVSLHAIKNPIFEGNTTVAIKAHIEMTNAVFINQPDFALSDFTRLFWSFYLTFKLAVKYNYRNHLEIYCRQNSSINVMCYDDMYLDYLYLLFDCHLN